MIILVPFSAATATLLTVLFIKLAFAVINRRQQHKVALGSGNHADLESAIRAHGNFSEYVPLSLALLLCAELNRSYWWLLACTSVLLIAGRYIHALAIAHSDLKKRVLGMKLTFAALAMGVIANIAPLVTFMFTL